MQSLNRSGSPLIPAEPGPEARASAYGKRIFQISAFFAGVGLLVGIFLSGIALTSSKPGVKLFEMLFGTFGYSAAGYWLGLAFACLFAPGDFLRGPVGAKWMKRIGTRSVVVARIMCFLALVISMPFVGFGLLMLWAWHFGP